MVINKDKKSWLIYQYYFIYIYKYNAMSVELYVLQCIRK